MYINVYFCDYLMGVIDDHFLITKRLILRVNGRRHERFSSLHLLVSAAHWCAKPCTRRHRQLVRRKTKRLNREG